MTCHDAQDRLDDYVDGSLSEADFQQMELHLAGCAACREEEGALRALLAEAAALPPILEPVRDLWPEIAARIAAPRPRLLLRPWPMLAVAAALLLGLAAVLLRPSMPSEPRSAGGVSTLVPAAASSDDLLPAEIGYARATTELLSVLHGRRERLSPDTLKVVDENLEIIDQALDQVREALRKDPGNHQLSRMLAATHQRKVDVLRNVVNVSS